ARAAALPDDGGPDGGAQEEDHDGRARRPRPRRRGARAAGDPHPAVRADREERLRDRRRRHAGRDRGGAGGAAPRRDGAARASVVVAIWGTGRDGGMLSGRDEQLTIGRDVAAALGSALRLLLVGPPPADAATVAARHGVAAIDRVADAALAAFQGDAWVAA